MILSDTGRLMSGIDLSETAAQHETEDLEGVARLK